MAACLEFLVQTAILLDHIIDRSIQLCWPLVVILINLIGTASKIACNFVPVPLLASDCPSSDGENALGGTVPPLPKLFADTQRIPSPLAGSDSRIRGD